MAKHKKVTSAYTLMEDIQSRSLRNTVICSILIVCSLVIVVLAFSFAQKHSNQVYVIDSAGVSSSAHVSVGQERKDLEINSHLTRFHSLMFTMIPNAELINRNVETALNLADESVYNYYTDLKEQQFYSRLIKNNISQEIVLDSIKCSVISYPYPAEVFGKVYVARNSNIAKYDFHSTCTLSDVERTTINPNGLRIGKFNVDKYELIETRQRSK